MSYHSTPWDDLDEPDFYSPDYSPRQKNLNSDILESPQSIYKYLDERVYGQTEYKKAISVFVYKMLHGIHSEKNLLIASESGSGKSFLISELLKILPNNSPEFGGVAIADASSLTGAGYRGANHVTTILNKLDTNGSSSCLVVLEEFNRLIEKCVEGDWSNTGLLAELLVLLDDKSVSINAGTEEKPYWVNPQNIHFILIGSFSQLTDQVADSHPIGFCNSNDNDSKRYRTQITKDQILKYLENWPEIIGRISRIVVNPIMDEKDLLNILKSPKYSPITKLEKELDLKIKITQKKMRQYAKEAFENRTGVRGIRNALIEIVDEAIFEDPHAPEVIIK